MNAGGSDLHNSVATISKVVWFVVFVVFSSISAEAQSARPAKAVEREAFR